MKSNRIATSAILMMASLAISHTCYLLVASVLARSLPVADFGTFNQVWLVNRSLLYVFALGLPVSVYYFLPRLAEAKRKGFVVQTLITLTALALPFSISMYVLADRLAIQFHNPSLAHHLRLFAVYPLVILPTLSTDAILIGLGRTKHAALFEMVSKMLMLAAVTAAGYGTHRLDVVLLALLIYGGAQAVFAMALVWLPVRRLPLEFSVADWKEQMAYAAPYGLGTLAGMLNYQVDKVLVALFYPPAAFALYAAGAFEIPIAGVTAVPVVSVMMGELTSKFTSGDVDGFLRLWHESLVRLAIPVFGTAALLLVIAEPVVVTMFSREYVGSVGFFRLYLLFILLRITVLEQVLAALGDTRFVPKAQVAVLLMNVGAGYLLVRRFGWYGPAISAVGGGYLFGALVLGRIRQRLGVTWGRVVPWGGLARIAGVAVLASACSAGILWVLRANPVGRLVPAFLAFATVYLLGNLRTEAITPGDLRTVWGWVLMARGAVTRERI